MSDKINKKKSKFEKTDRIKLAQGTRSRQIGEKNEQMISWLLQEIDPCTFEDLVEFSGLSRQAVSRHLERLGCYRVIHLPVD